MPHCCSIGAALGCGGCNHYAACSAAHLDACPRRLQVYLEDATPSYGEDTLEAFFTKAVKEGLKGQELGDQAVF